MNKPEDKLWKIEIHSETNTNGLTTDQVKDVLDVLNDEYHLEYQKNWNKKMQDEYNQYPVAKWQIQKGVEIEETFRNSLIYNIVDDKVSVDVVFDVTFPKSFSKGDVYQWIEGLDRLVKAHSMIQIEKLMSRKEKPFDEELSKQERELFLDLIKCQRWEVKKLD